MHGVFRVKAVRVDQLGTVNALLSPSSEQPFLLPAEVAEIAAPRAAREQRRPKRSQLAAQLGLHLDELLGQEQERRMTLERKPDVFAEAVSDEVEVTRSRTYSFRLRPFDEMLEAVETTADPASACETEQILGRLDEDGHLVAVVLAAVVEAVNRRSDGCAQDRAALDDLSRIHLTSFYRRLAWTARRGALTRCGRRDSNPHGLSPPVSETGASPGFRHIRTKSRRPVLQGGRLVVQAAGRGGCRFGRAASRRALRRVASTTTFAGRGR